MKKILLVAASCFFVFAGCDKQRDACGTVNTTAPADEIEMMRQYINSNGVSALEDSRGFFYTIISPGNGDNPGTCSNIVVNYTGQLTDGSFFDQGNNATFNLSNLVAGWKEGLPLIGEGGSIRLYLPPSLGYGNSSSGSIPANSITIFTIELLDVK